jgi:16S rRNA (guanine1207-N2)-methyltransferase
VLASRAHGRVLAARRPPGRRFKDALRDWRIESTVEIAGESRPWISYPGIFAAGRLDGGTALLLGAMPTLPGKAHVLDYGCGSGLVGAAALALRPDIFLDVLDTDAVALEAVHENIDGARLIAGACLADTGRRAYDAILSNPPLHQGFAEDHALLQQLVTDSPARLTPGGVLQIVVQHRLPLDRLFAEHFTRAETIADDGRYRVWRATRA